ncbi:hypothetical protein PanWU01x14_150590 [Parasponia andersonii]|uniref:MULE transposase domain-containing protein n=1 Tax=Parasponia andersonii TaxID=3476 RepID=A0A2P5CI74_PARAD|nr:hypothetical protein PanWU01x14_150590 [Parasponia andersonii]
MARGNSVQIYGLEFMIPRCYAYMVLKTNPSSAAKIQSKMPSESPYRDVLLAVIGVDAKRKLYPLAFAVVETENKDS